MIGLTCCADELPNKILFEEYYEKSDSRVVVDSGIKYFTDHGKDFDFAIGDFNSMKIEDEGFLEINSKIYERYERKRDFTDFEAIVNILIEKDRKTIYASGITGARLDHTISSLIYSKKYFDIEIELVFVGSNNIIKSLGESTEYVMKYDYISIVVLSSNSMRTRLKSFEYDSENLDVGYCSTLTTNGKIKDEEAYTELIEGYDLLIDPRD